MTDTLIFSVILQEYEYKVSNLSFLNHWDLKGVVHKLWFVFHGEQYMNIFLYLPKTWYFPVPGLV